MIKLLFLLMPLLVFAEIELIELNNRLAEEVLPLIEPFKSEETVIKAKDKTIIIKSSKEEIDSLKKIIIGLDKPLKSFKIYVSNHALSDNQISTSNNIKMITVLEGDKAAISNIDNIKILKSASGKSSKEYKNPNDIYSLGSSVPSLAESTKELVAKKELYLKLEELLKKEIVLKKELSNLENKMNLLNDNKDKYSEEQYEKLEDELAMQIQKKFDEIDRIDNIKNSIGVDDAFLIKLSSEIKALEEQNKVLSKNDEVSKKKSEGEVGYDVLQMKSGVYIEPILLNNGTIQVKVRSVNFKDLSQSETNTNAIVKEGVWTKVSGSDNQNSISTSRNDLWIKIELN